MGTTLTVYYFQSKVLTIMTYDFVIFQNYTLFNRCMLMLMPILKKTKKAQGYCLMCK